MDTSLIIILLVALVIVLGGLLWMSMTGRRTSVQKKKDETPKPPKQNLKDFKLACEEAFGRSPFRREAFGIRPFTAKEYETLQEGLFEHLLALRASGHSEFAETKNGGYVFRNLFICATGPRKT